MKKGQWDSQVLGLAQVNGMDAWITKDGVVYDIYTRKIDSSNKNNLTTKKNKKMQNSHREGHVFKMEFSNNNKLSKIRGEGRQESYLNYFKGSDKSKWATEVGQFDEMTIDNIYEGIDLRYYYKDGNIKYDYIVNPNADPNKIKFKFNGDNANKINQNGNLEINTSQGKIQHSDLYVYQEEGSTKKQIPCKFKKLNSGEYTFDIGNFDRNLKLVIDPSIKFSLFIGPASSTFVNDFATDLDSDPSQNLYISGATESLDFPSNFSQYTKNPEYDCFLYKVDNTGTLNFSIIYGGDNLDFCTTNKYSFINGKILIYTAGSTNSANFPYTNNKLKSINNTSTIVNNNGDAFLTIFEYNPADNIISIFYSAFWGSNDSYQSLSNTINTGKLPFKIIPRDMDIDLNGKAYICGVTKHLSFVLKNPLTIAGNSKGTDAGFISIINPFDGTSANSNSNSLQYSTLISPSSSDVFYTAITGIKYFRSLSNSIYKDMIYCVGNSDNDGFLPFLNTFPSYHSLHNTTNQISDGIFIVINPNLNTDNNNNQIEYATYFGRDENKDIITSLDIPLDQQSSKEFADIYFTGGTSTEPFHNMNSWLLDNNCFSHNISQNQFSFFGIFKHSKNINTGINRYSLDYFSKFSEASEDEFGECTSVGSDIKIDKCGRAVITGFIESESVDGLTNLGYFPNYLDPLQDLESKNDDDYLIIINPIKSGINDLIYSTLINGNSYENAFDDNDLIHKPFNSLNVNNNLVSVCGSTKSTYFDSDLLRDATRTDYDGYLRVFDIDCSNNIDCCSKMNLESTDIGNLKFWVDVKKDPTCGEGKCMLTVHMDIPKTLGDCFDYFSFDNPQYTEIKEYNITIDFNSDIRHYSKSFCFNELSIGENSINLGFVITGYKNNEKRCYVLYNYTNDCRHSACCDKIQSFVAIPFANSSCSPNQCSIKLRAEFDHNAFATPCNSRISMSKIKSDGTLQIIYVINVQDGHNLQNIVEESNQEICINPNESVDFVMELKSMSDDKVICERKLHYTCTKSCCEILTEKLNATPPQASVELVPNGANCFKLQVSGLPPCFTNIKVEQYMKGMVNGDYEFIPSYHTIVPNSMISNYNSNNYTFCCAETFNDTQTNSYSVKLRITLYDTQGNPCLIEKEIACPNPNMQKRNPNSPDNGSDYQDSGNNLIFDYSIMPNPTSDITTLNFNLLENAKAKVEIFNSIGKSISIIKDQVFSKGTNTVEFDAKNFTDGAYFVKISIDGGGAYVTIPLSVKK